jgi:hypothetical protein
METVDLTNSILLFAYKQIFKWNPMIAIYFTLLFSPIAGWLLLYPSYSFSFLLTLTVFFISSIVFLGYICRAEYFINIKNKKISKLTKKIKAKEEEIQNLKSKIPAPIEPYQFRYKAPFEEFLEKYPDAIEAFTVYWTNTNPPLPHCTRPYCFKPLVFIGSSFSSSCSCGVAHKLYDPNYGGETSLLTAEPAVKKLLQQHKLIKIEQQKTLSHLN